MEQAKGVVLTRKLILSLAGVLLWAAAITAISSLVTGFSTFGAIWLVLGLALAFALAQGALLSNLVGRLVPLASVALILVVLGLVAASEIANLFITAPRASLGYVLDAAFSIGILILSVIAAVQLIRAPRGSEAGPSE